MSIQLVVFVLFLMVLLFLFLFLVGEEAPSKDLSMSIQLAGVVIIITIFNGVIILPVFIFLLLEKKHHRKSFR